MQCTRLNRVQVTQGCLLVYIVIELKFTCRVYISFDGKINYCGSWLLNRSQVHALELSIYSTHLPPCTARSCGRLGIDYITRKGCAALLLHAIKRSTENKSSIDSRAHRRRGGIRAWTGAAAAPWRRTWCQSSCLLRSSRRLQNASVHSLFMPSIDMILIKLLVGFKKSSSCLLKQISGCVLFFYRLFVSC